jgi:Sigma-70 region 2
VDRTDFQLPSDILSWLTMNVIDAAEKIEITDDQLMKAVVDRKTEALKCIYLKYESLLGAVILGVIRDESEVDDILHDVMLQVWEQGDRYNPANAACAASWLFWHVGAPSTACGESNPHHVTEGSERRH